MNLSSQNQKEPIKVLINTPNLIKNRGGVSNHFVGFNKYMPNYQIQFCQTGGLRNFNKILVIPVYLFQYLKFILRIFLFKPVIVHLNPSLCYDSVIRDGIYLLIAKACNKKVIIFWHGWKTEFEEKIEKKYFKLFTKVYNKSNGFIVLSSAVKEKLTHWGFSQPILSSTTKVDDSIIKGFDINKKDLTYNILFLGRLEENKGIYESLKAFQILQNYYSNLTLTFAGAGPDEKKLKNIVENEHIQNILFVGFVQNEEKIDTYLKADIFILPSYTEGMPTTVLEAMAFGIPVITRPVGGIPDFFVQNKMGYLIESKDPNEFAERINSLYTDRKKWLDISRFNYNYAKSNFMASQVEKKMMLFYERILKN